VVHEFELWAVSRVVEEEFGFTEMQVISFENLIGGKLRKLGCGSASSSWRVS